MAETSSLEDYPFTNRPDSAASLFTKSGDTAYTNLDVPISIEQERALNKLLAIPRPKTSKKTFPPEKNNALDAYLEALAKAFNLSNAAASSLRRLRNYEIVLLCDDSGSMQTTVDGTQLTRWDELRALVKIIVLISVIFDQNGVDIYFLNRVPLLRVTNPDVIEEVFDDPPSGYSNLADALEYIFSLDMAKPRKDKKMLVFVATDAEPTNKDDQRDLSSLEDVMRTKRCVETTHVMFLLCNDSSECVKYLSKWDREMENVDLLDDYETEKAKVLKKKGKDSEFTYGEYILKAMLGAIDNAWDMIGELSD